MLHVAKLPLTNLSWEPSGDVWLLIRDNGPYEKNTIANWLRWSELAKQYVGYCGSRYGIDLERAKAAMVEEAERQRV